MRHIRCFFTILLLIFLLTNGVVEVLATNMGFSTEVLPEDDIDTFLKNINISFFEDEPSKTGIKCFDVNENGVIAIGCSSSDIKTVCIYTNDGDFQYGYRFNCSGDFGVELYNDNLIVYFVRSDVAIMVNSMGKVESILKIKNTSENNYYWNHFVFSTKRKVGDMEYMLRNDMGVFNLFALSYSQLWKTDATGNEQLIYDANSTQLFYVLMMFFGVLVSVGVVAVIITKEFRKKGKK